MSGYYVPEPKTTVGFSDPVFTPTTGAAYGAAISGSFASAPTVSVLTAAEIGIQETFGAPISEADAKKKAEDEGVDLDPRFYKDTTGPALQNRIGLKKAEMQRRFILNEIESSTALSIGLFAAGTATQFFDFANIASAYVPVAGLSAMTRSLKAGHGVVKSASQGRAAADMAIRGAGYGKRMGIGALEGAVGAAIIEPLVYFPQQYAGADYTLSDSMMNIAMGAPFGAVLHAAPKAFSDIKNKFQARKTADSITPEILQDYKDMVGEAMDVPALAVNRVSNEMIADELADLDMPQEFLEAAGLIGSKAENTNTLDGLNALAEIAPAEFKPTIIEQAAKLKSELETLANAKPMRAETQIKEMLGYKPESLSQFIRRTGGIEDAGKELAARDIKQIGKGSGLVKKSKGGKNQSALLEIPVENKGAIDKVKERVKGAGYFPEKRNYDEISDSELYDAIAEDANQKSVFNRIYPETVRAQLNDAMDKDPYRLIDQMEASGISGVMDVEDIAVVLLRQHIDSSAEIHNAPQYLRDAAFTVANAQMLDGRPIDIERVIDGSEPIRALQDLSEQYYEADMLDKYSLLQKEISDLTAIYDDYAENAQKAADEPIMFSRDKDGVDAEALTVDVRNAFGKYTQKLLETARVNVVQSLDGLPAGYNYSSATGVIKGVKYPDGRVFIVADHVAPAEVRGLLLHEVGVHVGMRSMIGDEKFTKLLDDVMASNDPRIERAKAAVPKDTPPQHIAEETLAYLVQNAPESNFVMRAFSAIRAWLYKTFGKQFLVDEFALRHMAVGSLRRISNLGEAKSADVQFSKDGDVLKYDNPGGDWLSAKRKYSDEDYAKGRKITGPITAYTRMVDFPTDFASTIKGAMGEIRKKGEPQFDALMKGVERDGFKKDSPILIGINHKGEAFIIEGNTRVAVAKERGIKTIPAEIRYYSGGEQVGGVLTPAKLNHLLSPSGEQSVIPGAEAITDKQLAERKMAQPLKAGVAQKRMDEGLFGEPDKQTALLFSKGKMPEQPDMKQLGANLRKLLAPFDDALGKAENYPAVFKRVLQNIADDSAAEKMLETSGIREPLFRLVLGEIKSAHKKTGNALRKEIRKIKSENILDAGASEEDMQSVLAARNVKEAILLRKRQVSIDFAVRQRMLQHSRQFGVDFLDEGLLSKISGSAMMRSGARDSAANNISAFTKEYGAMLDIGLRKAGLKEQFVSRSLDRQIASAMERSDDAKPDFTGLNDDAVKIAKILADINEALRLTQNRYGAYIKYRKNFSVHQSYDTIKIAKASLADFRADAHKSWNLDLMTEGRLAQADKMIEQIYVELKSGLHEVDLPQDNINHDFRIGSSVSKRVSMSRFIVFKKDKWYDFNSKYGSGDFATNFLKGIDYGSRAAGLMKVLGTNPEYNVISVFEQLIIETKQTNPEAAARLQRQKDKILNNLKTVDGRTEVAVNITGAKVMSNIRLWNMMSKLGMSIASNMVEVANYGANVRYEGRGGLLGGMGEAVAGIFSRNSVGVRREVLDQLDVTFDHLQADMMQAVLKGNTFTHNMSAVARHYTMFNFQRPWATQLQKSEAIGLSYYLGKNSNKKYESLSKEMSRLLLVHGIDDKKWDVLRMAAKKMDDGRVYLLTDAIDEIPDSVFEKYTASRGIEVNATSVKNARNGIAESYRTMIVDRLDSAVVTSDARARAASNQGTQRGTILGEVDRTALQFKSYPITYWERIVKREVYGRGYDTMGDYMRNGKGEMLGLAGLIAMQMALGYAALTIKDAIRGKTPRPLSRPGTWIEMARQSGAAGLYGDFLFNEYNKSTGSSLAAMLAGPTVGAASDIFDVVSAAARGDNYGVNLTRAIINNVPGANLIYVKPVLDNLIMYQLYENINPGFLRRMERKAEQKGQEWFMRPTQSLRL